LLPIRGNLTGGDTLVFLSDDCSGQPYLLAGLYQLLPPASVLEPGMTLYLPVPGVPPQSMVWKSDINILNLCNTRSDAPVGNLVPAVAVVDLLDLFTPPFSVRFLP
jgi:hypothetical protein